MRAQREGLKGRIRDHLVPEHDPKHDGTKIRCLLKRARALRRQRDNNHTSSRLEAQALAEYPEHTLTERGRLERSSVNSCEKTSTGKSYQLDSYKRTGELELENGHRCRLV